MSEQEDVGRTATATATPTTGVCPPLPPGASANDATAAMRERDGGKRQWAHEARGWLLLLPRTRMLVVPYESNGTSWDCVVVHPGPDPDAQAYPVGGYHISVGNQEIESAVRVDLQVDGIGVGVDGCAAFRAPAPGGGR